jgi:hypothetical protein
MSAASALSPGELQCLQNTQFLLTKRNVQQKLAHILQECQLSLAPLLAASLPAEVLSIPPKISRGENYRGLPYLVLDFPRQFSRESSLAFRTLCWWGHPCCCTLLLMGKAWENQRSQIINTLPHLPFGEYWLATGASPWEHHPLADAHKRLADLPDLTFLENKPFFKISRLLPLEQIEHLPAFSIESWRLFAGLLSERQ